MYRYLKSKLSFAVFIVLTLSELIHPAKSIAQKPNYAIFDSLSKVRSNLKLLANMDDTLTVGTIDVSDVEYNFLGNCFKFMIPVYSDHKKVRYSNPDKAEAVLDNIKYLSTETQGE